MFPVLKAVYLNLGSSENEKLCKCGHQGVWCGVVYCVSVCVVCVCGVCMCIEQELVNIESLWGVAKCFRIRLH